MTLLLCCNFLIFKLKDLRGAHDVHGRFKSKNSSFKASLDWLCGAVVMCCSRKPDSQDNNGSNPKSGQSEKYNEYVRECPRFNDLEDWGRGIPA